MITICEVYRRQANLTQIELGEMCGVSQVRISYVEHGKPAGKRTMQKIADIINYPGNPTDLVVPIEMAKSA